MLEIHNTYRKMLEMASRPGFAITEISSVDSSKLKVSWTPYPSANTYVLDLRIANNTRNLPFIIVTPSFITTKTFQRLRAGVLYNVTVKAFRYFTILASTWRTGRTGAGLGGGGNCSCNADTIAAVTWSPPHRPLPVIGERADPASASRRAAGTVTAAVVLPPSNIKITVLDKTAIRINWNPVANAFQYEVTVHKNSGKNSDRINPVQNVKALYSCVADSVVLSWNVSPGATSYRAVARSIAGVILYCTSSAITCQITGLDCSESFSVTVMAQTDTCNSSESLPVIFETQPCTPQNFRVNRDCHSNTMWASWKARRGAFLYRVTALASDGTTDKCNTRGTSCVFTFFKCGLEYKLKVEAISRDRCKSNASDPIAIRTAPCIPEGVKASTNCWSHILTISWELALGAQSYEAEVVGTNGSKYNCSSSTTSCVISELQCGVGFIVFVIAYDNECDSGRSYYAIGETAPCTPSNVHTQLDCDTNGANVIWDKYDGAINYMVSASGSDGTQMMCASVHTNCWLPDLKCGQVYTATVIASNYMCNSSRSSPVNFETAPCIPQNVDAHLDCATDTASVSWISSPGAVSYTASVTGTTELSHSCNTQQTYCEIRDLPCNQDYTVSVRALSENCESNQTTVRVMISDLGK
ncbi:fibronectin type III domain-containing protein 7-like [Pristis pectinata]|uniref:fibronectin type III domain-containing protein 7-like n=1 Tax=Pristis pectinata TaxID=685728 RepID=UPI00223E0CED|nr:fibronectin type III domain-containing protein 7-like [Pristis pectinata]